MITTRRSGEVSYEQKAMHGGIDLLEMPVAQANSVVEDTDLSEAQERMRKNLNDLLNYDRYTEENVAESIVTDSVQIMERDFADEDIRPTSTTMQFGEDIDSIRQEMNQESAQKTSYRLNNKGKVALVLYSLVAMVILALIILNTGVLANLSNVKAAKVEQLSSLKQEYALQQENIAEISDPDYIIGQLGEGWVKQ